MSEFRSEVYHVKVVRPNGSIGWQGGPDLALAAEFTHTFCNAVRRCWENRTSQDAPIAPKKGLVRKMHLKRKAIQQAVTAGPRRSARLAAKRS